MRHRAWANRRARDLEELALVLEHGLRQRLHHDLRGLDEARTGFLHRDAEASVFDARGAPAEAEHAAPATQYVEQRDLLGDAHRIVPGQHDHRGAERDALGAARVVAQQLRRRGRHRVAGEMMLEREQRVEAERLGEVAECEMLGHHRDIRSTRLGQHVQRDADFHGASSRETPWVSLRAGARPCHGSTAWVAYSASVTFSIQTVPPPESVFSDMARWIISRSGAAPCQWTTFGGIITVSPGQMTMGGSPFFWMRPTP